MKLYGHPESGHAYKVALALTLAKIPYKYEYVDINAPRKSRSPAFRAASKWQEVPCLVVEKISHIQSGAILLKLAREHNALNSVNKLDVCAEWINWEANRIGMCIPQLIQAQSTPDAVNESAQSWLRARYDLDIDRLDQNLGQSQFVTGHEISVADIAVYGYVSKYSQANLEITTNVQNWLDRVAAQNGWQSPDQLLGQQ